MLLFQVLAGNGLAAELLESSLSTEGNIPAELSAAGAPGLGPLSVRKDIVVFKEGFR
eukprot:gene8084-8278_t